MTAVAAEVQTAVAVPVVAPTAAVAGPVTRQQSYGQILKSSAIVGGSSVVNIAVSIVRAKAMALLLGPAGVGLVGLYSSVNELTHSIAGMGINSSGVRQIAEAAGSGESARIARTAAVLRRTSMALGLLGASPARRVPPSGVGVDVWQRAVRRSGGHAGAGGLAAFDQRRPGGV